MQNARSIDKISISNATNQKSKWCYFDFKSEFAWLILKKIRIENLISGTDICLELCSYFLRSACEFKIASTICL